MQKPLGVACITLAYFFYKRNLVTDFCHNFHGQSFLIFKILWLFSFLFSHFSLWHVLTDMLSVFKLLHTTFFFIVFSQMTSDTTTVRARPSTLASWSTSLLPWCPWPLLACLTICLTGTTMTNMWCLLCLTWSGVLFYWRYGE